MQVRKHVYENYLHRGDDMDETTALLGKAGRGETKVQSIRLMGDPVFHLDDMEGRAYQIDRRMSGCYPLICTKPLNFDVAGRYYVDDRLIGSPIISEGFMGSNIIGLFLRGALREYDKDYTVNSNGEIEWLEQTGEVNSEDDATVFDVDEFNTAYKKATGADISTITITGSDGVIRTYLDPTDRTLFNLTDENGTEYEYGRDYVIRVKDDGSGYVRHGQSA